MKILAKLFLILVLLLLTGCSSNTFFQLIEVGSTNCRSDNNYLFYENDTLRVVYMFWGENGVMGIFIHNKTDYPLYIDWKKCSFIVGTTKNDYWDESTIITTSSTSSTFGRAQAKAVSSSDYWFTNFLSGFVSGTEKKTSKSSSEWFQQTFSNSLMRINKPERITFIPPHATISQAAYNLLFGGITLPTSYSVLSRDTILYYGEEEYSQGHLVKVWVMPTPTPILNAVFNASNSPVNFRSFITYSTDEKFMTERYLDSKFYVSRVLELPRSAFVGQPDTISVQQNKHNMWASPSSFYIFFTEHRLKGNIR